MCLAGLYDDRIPSLGYIKIAKIGIYLHSYGDFIRFFGI
jgi:hypothetical protein